MKYIFYFILLFNLFSEPEGEQESKPFFRVFPIHRFEECEWATRPFICHKCILKNEKYAQKIYFYKNKPPFREHGCYTKAKGFVVIEE